VFAALQDVLGVGSDDVFKAATGLAGGTGLTCDSGCGAYMGGVLFLGSILGRERKNFSDPEGVRFKTRWSEVSRSVYLNIGPSSAGISRTESWGAIIFPTPGV
jgi:hypothetical protein